MISKGRWIGLGGFLFALLGAGGCTLLGDFSATQCNLDGDCAGLGMAARVCRAGQCVAKDVVDGDAPEVDGGGPRGTTNAECVTANNDLPAMSKNGKECMPLATKDCPLVWGDFRHDNPLYLGFFAQLDRSPVASTPAALNIKLAVEEINRTGGLRLTGGVQRPLVAVVCNKAAPEKVLPSARWLMDEVRVPAIAGQIETAQLKEVIPPAREKNVLLLSTLSNDDSLTATGVEDRGLLWHAIGDMSELATPYAATLKLVEDYLRASPVTGRVLTGPMKVAVIVSSSYETTRFWNQVQPKLRFNDMSAEANGANLIVRTVKPMYEDPKADYTALAADLHALRPHVIMSFAGDEFALKIVNQIEDQLAAESQVPFYIASPLNRYNTQVIERTRENLRNFRARFIGLDFAGDDALYRLYESRFALTFNTDSDRNWEGYHYLYDAVYTLSLAALASGNPPELRGLDLARGMGKLSNGERAVVGPKDPADPSGGEAFLTATSVLARGLELSLRGTTGRFDFDPGTGSRVRTTGAIYCFGRTANLATQLRWNKIVHNPATNTFSGRLEDCK